MQPTTWQRLFGSNAFLLSLLGMVLAFVVLLKVELPFLGGDAILFTPLLAAVVIFGTRFLLRTVSIESVNLDRPEMGFWAMQLLFFWIALDNGVWGRAGLHLKPHIVLVLFGLMTAVWFSRRYWDFLKTSRFFILISLFLGVNLVYYAFYHTNFNIALAAPGYPLGSGLISEFADADARTIVFVAYLSAWIAVTNGLLAFVKLPTKAELFLTMGQALRLLSLVGLIVCPLALTAPEDTSIVPGFAEIQGILILLLFGAWLWPTIADDHAPWVWSWRSIRIPLVMPLILFINLLTLFFVANKTVLVGSLLSILALFWMVNRYVMPLEIVKRFNQFVNIPAKKIFLIVILLLIFTMILASGILEIFSDKIQYFVKGFSGLSTLSVRTGNWYYFFMEWFDTLNLQHLLFGYGSGQSRESIFYVSAMRQANSVTLVQTLHNYYMELLYDYGLLAFLYLGALLYQVGVSLTTLTQRQWPPAVRLACALSISILIFSGLYGVMDGWRVQVLIMTLVSVAMLESFRMQAQKLPNQI